MMKMISKYLMSILLSFVLVSCIENDISYPRVEAEIISLELEGQKSVTIDKEARRIDVVMGELADMSKVRVSDFSVTEAAEIVGGMPEYLDLRDSVSITLRIYEDFVWTIKATQDFDRYIRCDNQVGEVIFDADRKAAYVYVAETQPLTSVKFNAMKLEPEGSVVTRTLGFVYKDGQSVPETLACDFPMVLDCVIMRYFYVEYKGEEIQWSVLVLKKAVDIGVNSVTPWACFADISATTDGEGTPVLEYRKTSSENWSSYQNLSIEGRRISARITGLEPETEYAVRLSNGEVSSPEKTFVTEPAAQLHNLSFDDWYQNGKVWMPNLNADIQIWDTANPGSAAIGLSPTVPETEIVVKGKAAKLETGMVNLLGIKKMAAGNIYTGKFGKIAGLGAELDWGVPFVGRPLALRGYYKYSPEIINVADDKDYKDLIGQTDECQIQIFLAEWDVPFHVNSSKKQFVDKDDKSIIAFSEFCTGETNEEYGHFTLPLVYNDSRMPTYIVISACASRYGNYFVGGIGSLLYIDEFELVYDPEELTEEERDQVFSRLK